MKNSIVSARVESNIKNEAENILQSLGIPVSVIINSLYRQIIYTRGVPFTLTVPKAAKTLDEMSATEFEAKLKHSYEQSIAGEGKPIDEEFD